MREAKICGLWQRDTHHRFTLHWTGPWPRHTPSFTFVRDPLERMISAFHESASRLKRCPADCILPAFVELARRGQYVDSFRAFVEHLTTSGSDKMMIKCTLKRNRSSLLWPCHVCALEHAGSQLWHLQMYPYPIDFVGRVESFEEDMRLLRTRFRGMHTVVNESMLKRIHSNARDTNGSDFRAVASVARARLTAEAPDAVTRLVRHLRQEYACFPFYTPPGLTNGAAHQQPLRLAPIEVQSSTRATRARS